MCLRVIFQAAAFEKAGSVEPRSAHHAKAVGGLVSIRSTSKFQKGREPQGPRRASAVSMVVP